MINMQTLKLYNGIEMPQEVFGVFQVSNDVCESVVLEAIETGYRLIDTASSYNNETAVGGAIRKSGLPREDFFITSKAFINEMGYVQTKTAFQRTLNNLGVDYLDLYLIHMPFGDYYGAWRAMEELYKEGRIRAIGVSNFQSDRIIDLCYMAEIKPMVDQLELHPFYQREEELDILHGYGIIPQAWAPFAEGMNGMFTNHILRKIAKEHDKTVAQVILRWNVQRDVSVIPKSVHRSRMKENLGIWDFELSKNDMQAITSLDLARSQMLDPHKPSEVHRLFNYLENPVLTSL